MNTPITCIVVDDEPLAREGMQAYIAKVDFLELRATCRNALEASELLAKERIDLMFLDINMPMLTGIEFLQNLNNPPQVIFTTAYREYALEGFELQAADYLLKPISFARFLKAVTKVRDAMHAAPVQASGDPHFYVKEDGLLVKVRFEDILWVEGVKDYIFIHTRAKRHMVLTSMKSAEEKLDPKQFMRVHRSHIVHLGDVDALEGNLLHIGQHRVPVSKQYRGEVLDRVVGNKLWKRE